MDKEISLPISRKNRLIISNLLFFLSFILISVSLNSTCWMKTTLDYMTGNIILTWGLFDGSVKIYGNREYIAMTDLCHPDSYDDDEISLIGFSCSSIQSAQACMVLSILFIGITWILSILFFFSQNIIKTTAKILIRFIRLFNILFLLFVIITIINYNAVYDDVHDNLNNITISEGLKWESGYNCIITSFIFSILSLLITPKGENTNKSLLELNYQLQTNHDMNHIKNNSDEIELDITNDKINYRNIFSHILILLSLIFGFSALYSNHWIKFEYHDGDIYYGLYNAETNDYYLSMIDLCDIKTDDDDYSDDINTFSCSLTKSCQALYSIVILFVVISYIISFFILFTQKHINKLIISKIIRLLGILQITFGITQIILYANLYDDIEEFQNQSYNSTQYYTGWGYAIISLSLAFFYTIFGFKDLNIHNNNININEDYAILNDEIS